MISHRRIPDSPLDALVALAENGALLPAITERLAELSSLKAELVTITGPATTIDEANEILDQAKAKAQAGETALQERSDALTEREAQIEARESDLSERTDSLQSNEQQHEARRQQLDEQIAEASSREKAHGDSMKSALADLAQGQAQLAKDRLELARDRKRVNELLASLKLPE